jgi:hypothetical protein
MARTSGKALVDTRLGNTIQYPLVPREGINMLVPDEVRQCVVFVGLPYKEDGQTLVKFMGTAFFVTVPSNEVQGTYFHYLVTAKHVAEKFADGQFLLRANTKDGKALGVSGPGAQWWVHPSDDSADVAVIPFNPPEELEYRPIPSTMFLSDEIIKNRSIGTGDEVFITGLFTHLAGSARNLPIVRMGNIAMMPNELVPTRDYGDIEAYLIEARSIGGLSGSPAFVRATVKGQLGEFYLLGLMHGHWDIPIGTKNDEATMDEDEQGKVNMGIAIVIPSKKILEVLNQPALAQKREEADRKQRRKHLPVED